MRARTVLWLLWLGALPSTGVHAQDTSRITLTIPGLISSLDSGSIGEIPHPNVEELRIALNRPRSAISSSNAVTIRLNGHSIPSDTRDDPRSGNALVVVRLTNATQSFSPSTNTVEVEFEERYRGPRYAFFVLDVRAPSTGSTRTTSSGNSTVRRHALVVGVSNYKYVGQGLNNLAYASRDAVDVFSTLINPGVGAIPSARACLLTDENATLSKVRRAIDMIVAATTREDVVMIFFAGQVLADPSHPESAFVVLYDSKPGEFTSTAMPMTEIERLYTNRLEGRRVVTFVDAGPRSDAGMALAGARLANELWLTPATVARGVAFAAAGPSQVSKESPNFGGGHGLFAFSLVNGLREYADGNSDGTVVVNELAEFLNRSYRDASDEGGGRTTSPRAITMANGALPLAGRLALGASPSRDGSATLEQSCPAGR